MTKKDYIQLAIAVRAATTDWNSMETTDGTREVLCKKTFLESLCSILAADNPRFDKEKFILACQVRL